MKGENYYIYNNGFRYETIDSFTKVLDLISGMIISLCTSSVNAETGKNIDWLFNTNGTNIILAKNILDDEIKNPKSGGYTCHSIIKNELIRKATVIEVDATATSFIGDKCDVAPTLAAELFLGIVYCADFHEAANAHFRGIPYIYKIHKDELKESNGINNYKEIHIKKVSNLIKEIKNKIIK